MARDDTRTVYRSDRGRVCPGCGMPAARCQCRRSKAAAPGDGIVRVGRERKGRRGKPVTTISGAPLDAGGLRALASELKRHCGSGGSAKDGVIEIQGDHREALIPLLEARGWRVKRTGG